MLEDIISYPTMCGIPNHAHILREKGGIRTEPANCQLLPCCT